MSTRHARSVRSSARRDHRGADHRDHQDEVLETLSQAVHYRRWLAGFAEPWLGTEPLEVGSGTGDYAAEWAKAGRLVTVSESDPGRLAALHRRFAGDPGVRVRELSAPSHAAGVHSAVVAYNVLEHIRDDVAALRGFAGLLRPGGHVILLVPAFPVAMSRFDREIGHVRRYRRGTLVAALDAAHLEPVQIHYVNATGLLLWVVGMRVLGMRPAPGPALTLFDRAVPLLARAEAGHPPPFGQSLLAVARRP